MNKVSLKKAGISTQIYTCGRQLVEVDTGEQSYYENLQESGYVARFTVIFGVILFLYLESLLF